MAVCWLATPFTKPPRIRKRSVPEVKLRRYTPLGSLRSREGFVSCAQKISIKQMLNLFLLYISPTLLSREDFAPALSAGPYGWQTGTLVWA